MKTGAFEELAALAGRVEALSGPRFTMDLEIFRALHPEYEGYVQGRVMHMIWCSERGRSLYPARPEGR